MNILSLCTGYGGLDLAVEAVMPGAVTRWVSDIDRDACAVQAVRFPDAEQLGDLKAIDWPALAGQVDILTAGYPCQPWSTAGRRQGVDDERHIWPWIIGGVRILRPRLVVMENVSGHLGLGFDTVLADLAGIGMDARWVVVRASDVGAPHRRARLFVVAADADGEPAGRHPGTVPGPQGEVGGVRRAVGPADGVRGVAADADGDGQQGQPQQHGGAPAGLDGEHRRHADGCSVEAVPAADADGTGPQGGEPKRRRDVSTRCGDEPTADADGTAGCGEAGLPGTAERAGPTGGGAGTDWGPFTAAVRRWEHLTGREAPAPLLTGTKQLNARMVEWMMGLPDGWVTDVVPNRRALKTLGNGVVPQQAEAALRTLLS